MWMVVNVFLTGAAWLLYWLWIRALKSPKNSYGPRKHDIVDKQSDPMVTTGRFIIWGALFSIPMTPIAWYVKELDWFNSPAAALFALMGVGMIWFDYSMALNMARYAEKDMLGTGKVGPGWSIVDGVILWIEAGAAAMARKLWKSGRAVINIETKNIRGKRIRFTAIVEATIKTNHNEFDSAIESYGEQLKAAFETALTFCPDIQSLRLAIEFLIIPKIAGCKCSVENIDISIRCKGALSNEPLPEAA